ncbi:lysylphosphatidylglycerol synthase transmembrane domain-containing protein [Enterococcus rivorum]|uniref:Phosphatidylglycerol lysyltransferase n=1 Tax=Enterococcus rivorum TaxID=762845 RepID=A0A1E5KXF3_9ENTE|nr:lysylphosphatidylglycerol synthase domain-containing protein [Enterococcus rivorum]MBP2099924.1 uncharacterized protein (TIRG00374 family) [Enterococcus rivorum]OEH82545.1 hypothetical protein BCR26_12890 [Enterococcus rivorum]
MKSHSKTKIVLNVLLLASILGVIFFVMDNSLSDIFSELAKTSWMVIGLVVILGTIYQIIEGQSIKEISSHFTSSFTTKDGFFASCYVAFYRVISFGTGTLVSEVFYYKKKGLAVSQGVGVTALHMIMYKAAVIFLSAIGLVIQFSLFYEYRPGMIPFILTGMILTFLIIFVLLILSSSINLQIFLVKLANKWLKRQKLRNLVDEWNLQIYSLRETVQTITKDRSALSRIFIWNICKLFFWYVIPYIVLVVNHPEIDFLLVLSFTSFAVILSGVFPTPAGIGPFEFIYLMLFKPLVGTVDAVSSLLLYRFGSFVLPFLIGMVYVLVGKRKEIKAEIQAVRKEREKALEEEQ